MRMKHALLAALLLLSGPAVADTADDYVACLIGRAAVELGKQDGPKDAQKAQEVAYSQCPEPVMADDVEPDGISDYVNMSVEALAAAGL